MVRKRLVPAFAKVVVEVFVMLLVVVVFTVEVVAPTVIGALVLELELDEDVL